MRKKAPGYYPFRHEQKGKYSKNRLTVLHVIDIIISMTGNFEDTKPNNETKAVMVSRLLTRENKARLLELAYLARVAENSIRKIHGSELALNVLPGERRSFL